MILYFARFFGLIDFSTAIEPNLKKLFLKGKIHFQFGSACFSEDKFCMQCFYNRTDK